MLPLTRERESAATQNALCPAKEGRSVGAGMPLERIGQIMQTLLREVDALGGQGRPKELFARAEPKLNLTDFEREVYEKSGHTRWKAFSYFYSVNLTKAGYIEKRGGTWYLTDLGRHALSEPPGDFIREATRLYRVGKAKPVDPTPAVAEIDSTEDESSAIVRQTAYEQAVEQARTEIEDHISELGPYDFQRIVAELLMAMGYFVPYIAPPGRDGGIDIIAYKDPLGTSTPRIRVQVKHLKDKVTVSQVRELIGVLHKDDDVGLIVSSGGFTPDAEREARSSSKHIETMDLNRLISLWELHYDRVAESGKRMLPLVTLHFLAPIEE